MSTSSSSMFSFRQSIALTALVTTVATTSAILTFQTLRREHRTEKLKKQVGEDVEEWEQGREGSGFLTPEEIAERHAEGYQTPGGGRRQREWKKGEFDEGLIREQLTRNYNFLGEESMDKIRNSYVVVVGCGGVGSWCALMLLRSGVGRILLVDFDLTTLSSLNRHACATLEDVGSPKVVAMQKFLKKVAPWAEIDIHVGLWRKGDEGESLLKGADYVVDAIDNIDTKVDLLAHCYKSGIKVFSSMGAGAKRDPTKIQIADISNTYEDPLARSVRQRLRKQGVNGGIKVVYSTEVPGEVKLLPLPEEEFQKGSVKHLTAFDDFRVRILPVLGPLPAIFGLQIATYILLELGGKPLTDFSEIKNRRKLYQTIERGLSEREQRIKGSEFQEKIPITVDDIGFIFEDLNNGRSTLPPQEVVTRPQAVRWSREKEATDDNVVIMSSKDAEKHEKECLIAGKSVEEVWGTEAVEIVQRRLDQARKVAAYRRS